MPKRIQRLRKHGWRMPAGAVYVGRPSKWGNYFVGPDAVEYYRKNILRRLNDVDDIITLEQLKEELKGKDLCCWCPLDKPCHADILLRLVNET